MFNPFCWKAAKVALLLGVTIPTFGSSIVLAQSQPGLVLQNLPDGDYFFGKAPQQYVFLHKTGTTITGLSFTYQTDKGYCFQGS